MTSHRNPDLAPAADPERSTPSATPRSGHRRATYRLRLLSALAALAAGAAACSSHNTTATPIPSAPAHHSGHRRGAGIVGKVTSIATSTLSIDVHGTTRHVTLTPHTSYHTGHQVVAESALSTGERVRVLTAANGDATAVAILPATATGTVVALDPHGFTLRTAHGTTLTVIATASATYRNGTHPATSSVLAPGQELHIQGRPGPNATFTATRISIVATAG